MGKIDMQKVIIGGLIAGVVLNVVDFVMFGVVLKDDMAAAMAALNKPAMTNAQKDRAYASWSFGGVEAASARACVLSGSPYHARLSAA